MGEAKQERSASVKKSIKADLAKIRVPIKIRFRFIYEIVLIIGTRELDGEKVAQDEIVRNLLFSFIYNNSFIFYNLCRGFAHVPNLLRAATNRFGHSGSGCNFRQSKYSRGRRGNLTDILIFINIP